MQYQLIKELSPECLLVRNEAWDELIFDKIPFVVQPRESLKKEIQKEMKKIAEAEKSIQATGLIKYLNMEKYQEEFYLVRESGRLETVTPFASTNIEDTCRALLYVLKTIQVYHKEGITLGGISSGPIKQGGKNSYCLQDPLILNYLSRSLTAPYQIDRSPEVIEGKSWGAEADIFSWGVLAYYLLSGSEPYSAATPEEKVAKILRTNVISLNDLKPELNPLLNDLILTCLNKDPRKRPKVEKIISQLIKLLEGQTVVVSEAEAKKRRERADLNLKKFKFRESLWLWFRKYGKVAGICLGIFIVLAWMFLGSKPKSTITALTKPEQVIDYYFEGVKTVNVSLVDEAIHKAKNNLSQMVANIHVLNTTNKATSLGATDNYIKIEIEGLKLEKLIEKPEEIKYRVDYRVKVAAPKVVEYLERNDEFSLKPIKKVWRITRIKVLREKNWKEKNKSNANGFY